MFVETETVVNRCPGWPERGTTWAKFWRSGEQEPEGSGDDLTSEVKGQTLVHFRGWPERSQETDSSLLKSIHFYEEKL